MEWCCILTSSILGRLFAQKRVNANAYKRYEDFAADVRLVFTNCLLFNHDPVICQPIRRWSQELLEVFDTLDEKARGLPVNRLERCRKILEALMRARKLGSPETQLAWCFVRPVDPVEYHCPDYYDVVKEPMDFGTISVRQTF